MAIVVEIDPTTGERKETVGGVVMLQNVFNQHADGAVFCSKITMNYAPGNYQVLTVYGNYKDGRPFQVSSQPTPPDVPLATVAARLAEHLMKDQS